MGRIQSGLGPSAPAGMHDKVPGQEDVMKLKAGDLVTVTRLGGPERHYIVSAVHEHPDGQQTLTLLADPDDNNSDEITESMLGTSIPVHVERCPTRGLHDAHLWGVDRVLCPGRRWTE